MSLDDVRDALANSDTRNKRIGVWIGILAALLAVCTMAGDNAAKDANRANIDATNTWGFFQAKNARRTSYMLAADELELMLLSQPALAADARGAIEAKIKSHRDTVRLYTSDPKTNEGLDELFHRGRA